MKATNILFSALIFFVSGCMAQEESAEEKSGGEKVEVTVSEDGEEKEVALVTRILVTDEKGEKKLTITKLKDGKAETEVMKGEEAERYLKKHEKDLKEGKRKLVKVRTNEGEKVEEVSVDVNVDIQKLLTDLGIEVSENDSSRNISIRSANVDLNLEDLLKDLNFDIDLNVEEDSLRKKVVITTNASDEKKKKKVVTIEVEEK